MKTLLSRLYRLVPLPLARAAVGLLHARFNITVVGVFFASGGRVLILRHVYRHKYPWGLPAGFVNAGETPAEAAVREVREEIGLEARVNRILDVTVLRKRHMEVAVMGTVVEGEMRPNAEIFEGTFVHPEAFPADMMPSQKALVARALPPGPVFSGEH